MPREEIVAIIAASRELTGEAGPVVFCSDPSERQRIARYISRVTSGMVHDLGNGVLMVIRH